MISKLFIIAFYNVLLSWIWLFIGVIIFFIRKKFIRIKEGFSNYLGFVKFSHLYSFTNSRSFLNCIIIHAVSVGECVIAIQLAKKIRNIYPNISIVITTTHPDVVSLAQNSEYIKSVFYFPIDILFFTYRFIKRIRPLAVILIETDFWLNFALSCKILNIPLILVNGRISYKLIKLWQLLPSYADLILGSFEILMVQTNLDKENLLALNLASLECSKIKVTGNIKFDIESTLSSKNISDIYEFVASSTKAKVIFGSLHPLEFELINEIIVKLANKNNILVLIVPRNIEHSKNWFDKLKKINHELEVVLRSDKKFSSKTQIVIVDSIGELSSLYSLSDVAFVGGTMDKNVGGHNPIEVISKKVPLIVGKYYRNFYSIIEELRKVDGVVVINDVNELYDKILALIQDKNYAFSLVENAYKIYLTNKGALDKTVAYLLKYFPN